MYMNTLSYLSSEAFSSIPPELVPDLQRMISTNESFRPTAIDFTGEDFLVAPLKRKKGCMERISDPYEREKRQTGIESHFFCFWHWRNLDVQTHCKEMAP
ncbi:hypothetical protein RchiOBHm_Chr7g0224521 [Rosa chinensis]|uniref:Uncharacterized protein n=1 Tax=Rosa chinensis TaxID=74649 RepID=A0A2P6PDU9_ROSCH|nr:hypothetical protein RchiOBHm_Chr7g0224521 [Rosa chinensis]